MHILAMAMLIGACSGVFGPRSLMAAAVQARLDSVSGDVQVARSSSQVWFPGTRGMALYEGDRVRTGSGIVGVRFADGTRVILRRTTSLTITRLDESPRRGAYVTALYLVSGAVHALVRPLTRDATFTITSARAITAVKGTEFVFDGTRVTVFDEQDIAVHQVLFSDRARRHTVLVREGMTAFIAPDGSIAPPSSLEGAHGADPNDVGEVAQAAPESLTLVPPALTNVIPNMNDPWLSPGLPAGGIAAGLSAPPMDQSISAGGVAAGPGGVLLPQGSTFLQLLVLGGIALH